MRVDGTDGEQLPYQLFPMEHVPVLVFVPGTKNSKDDVVSEDLGTRTQRKGMLNESTL